MGKNIEIKTFSDFEAMVNAGNTTYTGLVEGIGYVYWKTQTLYFIRTNPKELWATPKYQQIPFPYFQRKDVEIVNKTLYTLHVLSREELMKLDFDVYYAFYGILDEMTKLVHERDATRIDKVIPFPKIEKGVTGQENSRQNGMLSLGSQINDQIGAPLGTINLLMENKRIGQVGDGLSLISIVNDIDKGEYWSATGNVLLFAAGKTKLNPYLTAIDFAKWMYHTDLMQERLAQSFAKETLKYMRLYKIEEAKKSPNYKQLNYYQEKINANLEKFEECRARLKANY